MDARRAVAWSLLAVLWAGPSAASPLTVERPLTSGAARPAAPPAAAEAVGNSPDAEAVPVPEESQAAYVETSPGQDFEVHFLVSLPFTGLYSYLAVATLDGLVQGVFPTEIREADLWVVIGLALGSSLAVALGSAGRVPDQSQPRAGTAGAEPAADRAGTAARLPVVTVRY